MPSIATDHHLILPLQLGCSLAVVGEVYGLSELSQPLGIAAVCFWFIEWVYSVFLVNRAL